MLLLFRLLTFSTTVSAAFLACLLLFSWTVSLAFVCINTDFLASFSSMKKNVQVARRTRSQNCVFKTKKHMSYYYDYLYGGQRRITPTSISSIPTAKSKQTKLEASLKDPNKPLPLDKNKDAQYNRVAGTFNRMLAHYKKHEKDYQYQDEQRKKKKAAKKSPAKKAAKKSPAKKAAKKSPVKKKAVKKSTKSGRKKKTTTCATRKKTLSATNKGQYVFCRGKSPHRERLTKKQVQDRMKKKSKKKKSQKNAKVRYVLTPKGRAYAKKHVSKRKSAKGLKVTDRTSLKTIRQHYGKHFGLTKATRDRLFRETKAKFSKKAKSKKKATKSK